MEIWLEIPAQFQGHTLRDFLRTGGMSAAAIKSVKYQTQGFFLDGQPVHLKVPVSPGQEVFFQLPPEKDTSVEAQPLPLKVAYEDSFAMVVDKPAGIAVHPTLNHPGNTLANGYRYYMESKGCPAVFRPVNRIDKNTSGLVLCAQNSFSAPFLAASVTKEYLAVVEGALPLGEGEISAPIGRRPDSIIGRCVTPQGKASVTRYQVLEVRGGYSLVKCIPITGRTHQIRVHFSWLGHPLAGDDLYGGSRTVIGRHALHCGLMEFTLPFTQTRVRVTSPLPQDMAEIQKWESR